MSCGQQGLFSTNDCFVSPGFPQVACFCAHILISLCRFMSSLYQKALVRNLSIFVYLVFFPHGDFWATGMRFRYHSPWQISVSLSTVFWSWWCKVVLNFFCLVVLLLLLFPIFAPPLFISCVREVLSSRSPCHFYGDAFPMLFQLYWSWMYSCRNCRL